MNHRFSREKRSVNFEGKGSSRDFLDQDPEREDFGFVLELKSRLVYFTCIVHVQILLFGGEASSDLL